MFAVARSIRRWKLNIRVKTNYFDPDIECSDLVANVTEGAEG
jgi:hypothetical protein